MPRRSALVCESCICHCALPLHERANMSAPTSSSRHIRKSIVKDPKVGRWNLSLVDDGWVGLRYQAIAPTEICGEGWFYRDVSTIALRKAARRTPRPLSRVLLQFVTDTRFRKKRYLQLYWFSAIVVTSWMNVIYEHRNEYLSHRPGRHP